MASPISTSTGQPVNFHTNVNRAKTKRWVEAKSYAYDGDDWGDGDEYDDEHDGPVPQSAPDRSQHSPPPVHSQSTNPSQPYPGQRYGDLPNRNSGQFANRSATNPAPVHNRNQPSFDQGDERRAFSTSIGGFEGPYPTAQRSPFPPVDHFPQGPHSDHRMAPQRGPPSLSSRQQGRRPSMDQEPFPRAQYMSDNRPGPYSDPRAGPYPGPMPQQGRRSQSSGRPSHVDVYGGSHSPSRAIPSPHADIYGGGHSPIRAIPSPRSAVSQGSRDGSPGKSFPPRKSSLSQQAGPSEFNQPQTSRQHDADYEQPLESPVDVKPLPFIRPADIYKRIAEEKERERRESEESSRPSIDDLESQKRLKPALDPVQERRSEYGIGNPVEDTESAQMSSAPGQHSAIVNDDRQGEVVEDRSSPTHDPLQRVEPSSVASDIVHFQPDPNTGNGQNANPDQMAGSVDQRSQGSSALRHNPSTGFTSVVHQAFDDSQAKVPPTPPSTSGNSIMRSNSDSASDISPIMERAPSGSGARPMSSSTITPTTSQNIPPEQSDSLPAPIRPGYRRDSRTPSPGNSPARRPISVGTGDAPREEPGIVSASTPTQSKPLHDAPSSIPRAESPTKGTVRDLAGKLENHSPASSPVRSSVSVAEVPRPSNPRLESFRPSLPGAWTSYTTSTGTSSPVRSSTPLQSTDPRPQESTTVLNSQEDEIPTAGPPKPREPGFETSGKAFEALAAAGSALSGAFHAVTGIQQDDSSENENSTEASTRDSSPVRERPGGLSPVQEVLSVASSAPPTPAKDAPRERKSSQLGYFPSPLRTSKSTETPTPMRPQMLPALSTDNSPQDTENDRLRKEIVRSLTPKSTKAISQLRAENEPEPVPISDLSVASRSTQRAQGNKSPPHREDDDSWDEPARREAIIASGPTKSAQNINEWYTPSHTEEAHEQSVGSVASTSARPLLQNRFSWEASTESVGILSRPAETAAAAIPQSQVSESMDSPRTIKAPTGSFTPDVPLRSKPSDDSVARRVQDRPTIIPVSEPDEELQSDLPPRPIAKSVDEPRASGDSEPEYEPVTTHDSRPGPAAPSTPVSAPEYAQGHPSQASLPATTAREMSFREILNLNTPQERIQAYNRTRHQLAAQDSGLANWLHATGSQHPEHHVLLKRNGRLQPQQADAIHSHKPSPSRSKFPRIGASLGGGGQQPPAEGNDASKPSLGSPSSGKLTSQQVQEEGKKLLQSAGKIGGKAGGAAKGLFAKGKNKFRASSGGDKALLPNLPASPPPTINVENVQHPSGTATATAAPQIAPLFPRVISSNDTWSPSYAASDNISRTTTIATQPPTEKPVPEQPRYANLGPPGYPEYALDAKDGLTSPPAPSPQVSALGSTYQDDIPSRSISEVTRPDEQPRDASPTGSLGHGSPSRADNEAHLTRPAYPAEKSPPRSPPASSPDPNMTRPLAGANTSVPGLEQVANESQHAASSGSSYSLPVAETQLQPRPTQIMSTTQDNGPGTESPSTGLEPRRSVVSAMSSPSPGPPTSDQNGLSSTITRPIVSSAQQDADVKGEVLAASLPARSPPYEDATPPYSATMNTKEAEAAAERLALASEDHRQSLPAYQSPIQEKTPPLPFQPSAVVPVADLSARRREEDRLPPARPFSFVETHPEDILHPHTASKESQRTSRTGSSLSKELGLDRDEPGNRPYSRLCSRPLNEADLGQHPALRGSIEKPLPSQDTDFASPQRPTRQSPLWKAQNQSQQQFRIPGPYGQQFRSNQPVLTSSDAGQSQLQRPPNSARQAEHEPAAGHPSMINHRPRSSDVSARPRLSTTEYSVPGIGPPHPPAPSDSVPKSRTSADRLFHLGSKLRSPLTTNGQSDLQKPHHVEEKRWDRRGSMFRPRSRQESESSSSQFDSTKGNANRSKSVLEFYQRSPDMQARGSMQNGTKTKGKDTKLSKRLQRLPPSNNQTQTENKKKGGFLRLSGLFGKSGKESVPPAKGEPLPRTVTSQTMLSPPPPRAPGAASPVPYQEHPTPWRSQGQVRGHSDPRSNSFQGRGPPVGGYYAPANGVPDPSERQPRRIPRDPDAFIGGLRLSDQRAAEQARHLEYIAGLRSQKQAEKPHQSLHPHHPANVQPHSAPPTTQHFSPVQTQQPRAASQRFPPGLRIDTSGRLNANRRSQPIPVMGAMSNANSTSRDRAPFSEIPPNIPTHSNSSPQRRSPYTDRNSQHSPYGYGTARGLRKDNLSHAIDLHKRSRSPRNGRRESFDSQEEGINAQDPANKLGTFSETHRSKSQRAAQSGEDDGQEKPWKIDLPVGDRQRVALGSARGGDANAVPPVELPGSKAPGDEESDEEIVMCSTAYPGQEWVPEMPGYGHWDDHVQERVGD